MTPIRLKIHRTLQPIKPVSFSKGYHQLVLALEVIINSQKPIYKLQDVLSDVAIKCDSSSVAVEKNIRRYIKLIDKEKLRTITGLDVPDQLTTKTLVDILVYYIDQKL